MMVTHVPERSRCWLAGVLILFAASAAFAQTFDSGSDGSDGALTLTTPGTYIFDPQDAATFGRGLDPDGDGIFNFTTITIGAGVTVKFAGDRYNRPVFWLASGAVQIHGVLDLTGADGTLPPDLDARRKVAVPGSGGYAGGAGGCSNIAIPATDGEGPGGGVGAAPGNCAGGGSICGKGGVFTGNRFLVPLFGGSGGAGAAHPCGALYYGGGAGGGAILIASSVSITIPSGPPTGAIIANGGQGGASVGGNGSGGAIRLVAPIISGGGSLHAQGGTSIQNGESGSLGGNGRIRLEAFQQSFILVNTFPGPSTGFPTNAYVPQSSVRIASIDGVALPQSPAGTFVRPPDVAINQSAPVPVVVRATGIPPGTTITLQVFSDNPNDPLTVNDTYTATLGGTLQSSSATVAVLFTAGLSRCFIRVSWLQ